MRSSGHNLDERVARSQTEWSRVLAIGVAATLALGACSGSTATGAPPASGLPSAAPLTAAPTPGATAGGTIYILNPGQQFGQVDPQRAYNGPDLAFFGSTIYRSLEAYTSSPDPVEGTTLTPDLATDLGSPTDGGKTWAFTLRDGVKFQDGSPITCADVKYGISRTFATDVIDQGPTYAIQYLDIPTEKDGSSSYKGPYKGTGQALYDKAVECSADGKTITFHLNRAVGDFNYTVTLGFSPVPKTADTGETYGTPKVLPVSSGPYQVESYATGNGGKMILVRNPNWSQASDPYRTPYPDRWEVDFGIDPKVIDQRIMQSGHNDQYAIPYGQVEPENLAVIFKDPETPNPYFAGRAISGFDPYVWYYWINVQKVKNVNIRQAMAVALDRSAIRRNSGGAFAGSYADGVIKPSMGTDSAPTGMWTDLLGKAIPDGGDPEYAKQLIAESGEPAPKLVFNFINDPTNQKTAAIVMDSLGKAGFTVTPAPIDAATYFSVVFDPAKAGDFGFGAWGADWPNASTVIPPLFTVKGGWDLSQVDDAAFNGKVEAAQVELDRAKQATMWQALNEEAMQNAWAIPVFFDLSQSIAGTKIAPVYRWPAYGSWPFAAMYVKP
jgi:peptide/nickel transport system substrate-binding protein